MVPPRRVLLAGDWHGNTRWAVQHVYPLARKQNCDVIVQLGDFGFWHGREGERYLDVLNEKAATTGIPILWIDGNHENFDLLYEIPVRADGLREVRPHVLHVPRAHRWTWGGRQFLACGGAASIDMAYRMPGRSWWAQESITTPEMDECIASGPVDVMLAHDTPVSVDMGYGGEGDLSLPLYTRNAAYGNRLALQHIVDAVQPALYVHGHWHVENDRMVPRTDGGSMRVVSLQADDNASPVGVGHCALLDLTVAVTDPVSSWVTVLD